MSDGQEKLLAALDIMQRMPPSKIEQSLTGLLNLIPEETDELLQRIDQPLTEHTCPKTGKKYLLCDYNRDGDSFRSPYSNEYDPPIEDGLKPSASLRKMEVEANKIFSLYVHQYYGTNVSNSVYFWDLEDKGFASCWLVKKGASAGSALKTAVWDAIHVLQVVPEGSGHSYQLTSTVMVNLGVENDKIGDLDLSGSLIRQRKSKSTGENFIAQMGRMVEEQETAMKCEIEELYFRKMAYVMANLRQVEGADTRLAGLAGKAEKEKGGEEKAE